MATCYGAAVDERLKKRRRARHAARIAEERRADAQVAGVVLHSHANSAVARLFGLLPASLRTSRPALIVSGLVALAAVVSALCRVLGV